MEQCFNELEYKAVVLWAILEVVTCRAAFDVLLWWRAYNVPKNSLLQTIILWDWQPAPCLSLGVLHWFGRC